MCVLCKLVIHTKCGSFAKAIIWHFTLKKFIQHFSTTFWTILQRTYKHEVIKNNERFIDNIITSI